MTELRPQTKGDDPLGFIAFRKRLVMAVLVLIALLSAVSSYFSHQLTGLVSHEKAAATLAQMVLEGEGTVAEKETVSALRAQSIRSFSQEDGGSGTLEWGVIQGADEQIWSALTLADNRVRLLRRDVPPVTPAMQETVFVRLLLTTGILVWLTFWTGLIIIRRITNLLEESASETTVAWTHDASTGLPNLSVFQGALPAPDSEDKGLVVQVTVQDYFIIQDTLGPSIAEDVVVALVKLLSEALPDTASLARSTTQSLMLWVPEVLEEEATEFADTMRELVSHPLQLKEHSVLPTIVLGIACRPSHGQSADDLLSKCGRASRSQAAKNRGFALYDAELEDAAQRWVWMRPALQKALEEYEITLHFQPQYNAAIGQIVGMEALARWTHPERGPVRPDQFIEVAEQSGLIEPLTEYLFEVAALCAKELENHGLECPISFNISAISLQVKDCTERLLGILRRHELSPRRFHLEITETAAMEASSNILNRLKELQAAGFHLSMDDFGSGHASLGLLRELPYNTIKIDQRFIRNLGVKASVDNQDWGLVAGIIQVLLGLKRQIIAEGVEDERVGQRLAALGCYVQQGWAYAKAMPFEDVLERLLKQREAMVDIGYTPPPR